MRAQEDSQLWEAEPGEVLIGGQPGYGKLQTSLGPIEDLGKTNQQKLKASCISNSRHAWGAGGCPNSMLPVYPPTFLRGMAVVG